MENTQEIFEKQYSAAQYIQRVKQKQWLEMARKHVPVFAADYLFYKNPSHLTEMLRVDPEIGFKYDPETLHNGIEILFKILESKNSRAVNKSRLKSLYSNFATPEIRVNYLRTFAEYLELYPIIGEQVIADLEEVGKTTTDPEFLELLPGRLNSVKNIMKIQAEDSGYQYE